LQNYSIGKLKNYFHLTIGIGTFDQEPLQLFVFRALRIPKREEREGKRDLNY
jgi:hypothetical protein